MILNNIRLSNLSNYNFIQSNNKINRVSFGNSADKLHLTRIEKAEFGQGLSDEAKKQIVSQVREIAKDNNTLPLGYGATGVVYKTKPIDGVESDGTVIKISHTKPMNELTLETQKVGCDFKDEVDILKEVKSLGANSQQYLASFKLGDGRNVLVSTFVKGKNPDPKKNPLTKESMASALVALEKLDEASILHRDLKKENLLLDGDEVKLIDYGESITFDYFDKKRNSEQLFFMDFETPTNLQNFEDTFVSPYLDEFASDNPKKALEFYKQYLELKSSLVHSKKLEFLQGKLSTADSSQEDTLNRMIDYQATLQEVLSHPNKTVMQAELMKNQITYSSELAYKNEILLANPLANITLKANALLSAKRFEKFVLDSLSKPNSVETKKYLEYQLQIARFRQKNIAGWLSGFCGWFCECMKTNIDTPDSNKKNLIDQCLVNKSFEDFDIPNITNIDKRGE